MEATVTRTCQAKAASTQPMDFVLIAARRDDIELIAAFWPLFQRITGWYDAEAPHAPDSPTSDVPHIRTCARISSITRPTPEVLIHLQSFVRGMSCRGEVLIAPGHYLDD